MIDNDKMMASNHQKRREIDMKSRLAENIKAFRRERNLTQEQLAEAMGVTVGAVYKWESRQSNPDLNLIIEL